MVIRAVSATSKGTPIAAAEARSGCVLASSRDFMPGKPKSSGEDNDSYFEALVSRPAPYLCNC